ncbi:cobalamin biosynthesis protein CobN [Marinomonas sp. S3726]|uniref:cobaltochelatase subunit CobN n=1 Tax=Marinomonas sp. S3726 TaxID=579484 RepID=UPI0005FA3CF7|nr:cobaltochelatase subunit CobN [Marinomonas sp. S3726]KJZ14192.1 cobalamin biosynthesis protein CobN [Marinomonas sp. S3726]
MHLLAAKPGGFVDDEGIIDLDQSPADIVCLAAADSLLSALAQGVTALDKTLDDRQRPSIRLANWMQLLKPAAYDLYEDKVLEKAKLVVVSFLGGKNYWPYGYERLVAWSKAKPGRTLVMVPGDDVPDPELAAASNLGDLENHKVWRFLRESGTENLTSFWHFLFDQVFALSQYTWQEPKALASCLVYLKGGASSLVEWRSHYVDQLQQDENSRPVCLLVFYRNHLQSANTQMFDQLIRILEAHGLVPLAVAVTSLKDAESLQMLNGLIESTDAKLVLNTTGFASNRAPSPDLAPSPTDFQSSFERPLPVLQLVLSSSTEEDWQEQNQGLRNRDLAMQVVLPEMDGRIISRAVSFKQQSYYDPACEIDLIRYAIHQERAHFVAALAKKFANLAVKPNSEKRIALILANYPTKDGRIGNGVGLDTPASTVTILNALAESGYPINEIPEDGNALIESLLGSVTNNPNTMHHLGCWQSLSLDEYNKHFALLPKASQEAVLSRWGEPEADHKCRVQNGQARIMLAGIRLGQTFVGIQPARGFNLDLAANYHDPDLIPPHSYLAYYFWLRHVYKVDAIIHVGKHGNLEWLPGKGAALSDECWPDIAMGPMPHFYPFIVNDPGEGSQAKRRTQAVIIDHLMPPMTRAESYGELAELENLVDEFYQAMGMDERRENWLKEQILKLVKETHVLDELAPNSGEDEAVLAELDTYLCEIKESQIRHGLHRLGQLPDSEKLADTLVALLRLPRGTSIESQGIIHSLAHDFGFIGSYGVIGSAKDDLAFDPSQASSAPWLGNKPAILDSLLENHWRTHADTKERLEVFAQKLILEHLLSEKLDSQLNDQLDNRPTDNASGYNYDLADLPNTQALLSHAKQTLLVALKESEREEINAIIKGLAGKFVAPGPSGAPTRGRLDTLPTGRNFFSVDNRAIPSKAAWALGEKSAEALILRHLQEHGDYPKELGLSVWGTATMRTGGDDIAQAFALMGVRPVWAAGSNRVTDFEVLSCMRLGRPRVDVTLRVSGFFRDAFASVMQLYDAAVQAIVDFEEPGTGNLIRNNVLARQQALEAQGLTKEEARQEASYRVFGSKPGAYGAGLQGLIDERCWDTQADLAEAYVNWGGYAYGAKHLKGEGIEAKGAFEHRLSQLEVVVQNQDNREHDILDSDDYYQFQGGMTNAVTQLAQKSPEVYLNDHSNPSAPKVRTLKEELNRVVRSRVLNPKWIEAMQEHGYKGAFEMAASIDYLFAYDATTDLVADYQYEKVTDALVFDGANRAFLEQNNINALEEMAERLLEACQRGMWQEPNGYETKLQDLLLELDMRQEQAN